MTENSEKKKSEWLGEMKINVVCILKETKHL